MLESKESPEEYANSPKGLQRLGRLKWWFIALLALGVVIAFVIFVRSMGTAYESFQLGQVGSFFVGDAFAQSGAQVAPFDPKPIVMTAIIAALLIVFLGSVWAMLSSSNTTTIQAAGDLTKVLVGFFVGVATKFLGG
jgi:hypothetical protein